METDLHGEEQVLQLLELLVESAGKPVRQVPFHVTELTSVDTATPEQIGEAVRSFLKGTAAISTRTVRKAVSAARPHRHVHGAPAAIPLTPTTDEALAQARSAAPNLPFALEYPRAHDAFAGAEPEALHLYELHDQQGHGHPTYVIVIDRGGLGEYYDVQGSSWTDPPLLSNPSQTVRIGSRTYDLYYAGEQIRTVAWREGGAAYWIENTLTNSIGPLEMLAMAEQTLPVINVAPAPVTVTASPSSIKLPPRALAGTSSTDKLEAALGLLSLVVVVCLALFLLWRQRELARLREQVAQAMALEARRRRRPVE